jgi:hypothetical protein
MVRHLGFGGSRRKPQSRLLVPAALAILAIGLGGCGSGGSSASASSAHRASGVSLASASRPSQIYRLRLSGSAETPPGAQRGTGAAIIAFHGDSVLCWRFSHLHGFTHATFAHIHIGATGRAGKIVVALSTASLLHHRGCVSLSPVLGKMIVSQPSRYYVNIHSQQYPAGAVRAQL